MYIVAMISLLFEVEGYLFVIVGSVLLVGIFGMEGCILQGNLVSEVDYLVGILGIIVVVVVVIVVVVVVVIVVIVIVLSCFRSLGFY